MNILNLKLGFSSNSSSSHSMLLIPDAQVGQIEDDYIPRDFGRFYDFVLASQEAKAEYLAVLLYKHLLLEVGREAALKTVEELAGVALFPSLSLNGDAAYGWIDHQSSHRLPCGWDGAPLDGEFWRDFTSALLQENVLILGGDDRGEDHPLIEAGVGEAFLPAIAAHFGYSPRYKLLARKDVFQGQTYWTVFNQHTGARVTMGLDMRDRALPAQFKPATPFLVDVKITDYCDFGCPYCYQGSTPRGAHADFGLLRSLAATLGRMKVFEVALGGGSPEAHPRFLDILRSFQEQNVTPNFTTRSLKIWEDGAYVKEMLELAGGIAYSCERPEALEDLARAVDQHDCFEELAWRNRLSVQIIPETLTPDVIEAFFREADRLHLRLTLLGYKTTGRGAAYLKKHALQPADGWLAAYQNCAASLRTPYFSIDTTLAEKCGEALQKLNVPAWSYFTQEGLYSMYVDGVKGRIAASSYADEAGYLPLFVEGKEAETHLREAFARW